MKVHVADHPLISHKLTVLRDEKLIHLFRHLVEELVTLLSYEATREVKVEPKEIKTPVSPTIGVAMSKPTPVVSSNSARRSWHARRHGQVNAKC
jgi:uracil phosphoribosyltransferase